MRYPTALFTATALLAACAPAASTVATNLNPEV